MKVPMSVTHDHQATGEQPRVSSQPRSLPQTQSLSQENHGRLADVLVDPRKLWSGGAASAAVAGLVALVGVLVTRWLFSLPVLAPSQDGAYGDVSTTVLVLLAAAAALAATGLVHLLLLNTPRPFLFFGWIVALVTTLVVVYPFSTTAPLGAKIATAAVFLAIGAMTGTLVGGAAARSIEHAGLR
jgi:FtsH-binding integral membrane protein